MIYIAEMASVCEIVLLYFSLPVNYPSLLQTSDSMFDINIGDLLIVFGSDLIQPQRYKAL